MSSVVLTQTFAPSDILTAGNLNTALNELLAGVNSVGSDQIDGGITQDQIQDNHAVSWACIPILPISSGADLTTPAGYTLGSAGVFYRAAPNFQPLCRPGWECQIAGLAAHIVEADVSADDAFDLRVRRNAAATLGGQVITMDTDDTMYLVAQNDPIANPLEVLSEGDYLDFFIATNSGTPTPRGLTVYLAMKHVLVAA